MYLIAQERRNRMRLFVADPCADVSCKPTEMCELDERRRPVCRCGDVCDGDAPRQRHRALTAAVAPVCGSDGRTYRNACAVSRYICRKQHEITILYQGSCISPVTTGQSVSYRISLRNCIDSLHSETHDSPMSTRIILDMILILIGFGAHSSTV